MKSEVSVPYSILVELFQVHYNTDIKCGIFNVHLELRIVFGEGGATYIGRADRGAACSGDGVLEMETKCVAELLLACTVLFCEISVLGGAPSTAEQGM